MRTKITRTKLYIFNELPVKAQEKAINDHINFLLEVNQWETASDNFKKAVNKAEAMLTPWFTGSYVYEYCKDEILADLESNHFEFTIDGNIA
jgi:TorA maturation chaperone TorD